MYHTGCDINPCGGYGMRIFKNAWFARYARKQDISDKSMVQAIERAEQGLIDADLGGGVIKQRVARPGQDRKSTRLNSSHSQISYAVFCLKKKKKNITR